MGRPAGQVPSIASLPHARINSPTPSQMTSKLSLRIRRRLVVGGWPSPLAMVEANGASVESHHLPAPLLARAVALCLRQFDPSSVAPPRRTPARLRRRADPQMKMGGAGAARRNEKRTNQPRENDGDLVSALGGGLGLIYGPAQRRHSVRCPTVREGQRSGSHGIIGRTRTRTRTRTPGMALLASPRTVTTSPFVLLRAANTCPQ